MCYRKLSLKKISRLIILIPSSLILVIVDEAWSHGAIRLLALSFLLNYILLLSSLVSNIQAATQFENFKPKSNTIIYTTELYI